MTGDVTDVLASLGRKLDSLDLTDAERAALTALLPAPEVEGFEFRGFEATLRPPVLGGLLDTVKSIKMPYTKSVKDGDTVE